MNKQRFKLVAAVHLFLVKEEKILLLRRFNTGYEDGNYSVPAGHIDGGESISTAMIREAYEEAKIILDPEQLFCIHTMHRTKPEGTESIDFFFTATNWDGEVKIGEPDKCDELSWFDIGNLPKNTIPYISFAIEQFQEGKTVSEYGWVVE